jgi:uncharacterized membrane protein
MRQRGNMMVLTVPTVIALWSIIAFALSYVTGDPEWFGIYQPRYQWLLAHAVAGIVALLLGPSLLWLGLNHRTGLVHHSLGVLYVASVGTSATTAFYLALHTDFGWVFGLSFASMACAWIIATAVAVIAICRRSVVQHREWMIRSYVLTFGFVTFRILDGILELVQAGTIVERKTAASWLAWAIPLLLTEIILQGRKIFMDPVAAQPAKVTVDRVPPPIPTTLPKSRPILPPAFPSVGNGRPLR